MPLMIYGADVDNEDTQLTIDNFTSLIDPQSWDEFMPQGVTKQHFNHFKKYYDPDIFSAAAKRIRAMARAADRLSVEQRIQRITSIFSSFRNPDKETVLTPWGEHRFFVGIAEGGENRGDALYALLHTEPIGCTSHGTDALGCCREDVGVIIFFEVIEVLFGHTLWHKFVPRLRVDERGEIVDGELGVFVVNISAVNHQWHTNGNASKNRNGILLHFFLFLQLLQTLPFFFGELFFRLLLQLCLFFVLLIGESLVVDIDLARICLLYTSCFPPSTAGMVTFPV